MSAAIPLKLFPVRGRTLTYTLLIVMLFLWPLLMLASRHRVPEIANGIEIMLEAACLLIAAIGALQMKGLARAREVFRQQQMPDALWRSWVRACVVETSLIWAFLGATTSALLASPASPMPWPVGFALLSSCLCVGAIGMMSRHAMLPKRLDLLASAIGGALLLAAMWLNVGETIAWVARSVPWAVLALLTLTWPVLAGALIVTWRRLLGTQRGAPAAARSQLVAALDSQVRRYSPLDWNSSWAWRQAPRHAAASTRFGWLVTVTMPVAIFIDSLWPLGWQQEPDARHLLSLAFLSLIMTSALVARDLHWRSLLMPGGWRNTRIASDIFRSTLNTQYLAIAAVAIAYMLVQRLFNGIPIPTSLELVASHVLVLAEVAFASSVALVIRALPRPTRFSAIAAAVLAGCWIYMRWVVGYAALSHWPAGGTLYAAALVAATFAILRLANRMWTTEKLLACARHGA